MLETFECSRYRPSYQQNTRPLKNTNAQHEHFSVTLGMHYEGQEHVHALDAHEDGL